MKNTSHIFALACLIAMLACEPQTSTTPQQEAGVSQAIADTLETLYAVPLANAQTDTARYDSIMRATFKKVPIKAFTIRSADFLGAIGLPESTATPFTHVRIYLGMSSDSTFKLFLTPVVDAHLNPSDLSAGRDSILAITKSQEQQFGIVQNTQYVFDFSAPCPTTCP